MASHGLLPLTTEVPLRSKHVLIRAHKDLNTAEGASVGSEKSHEKLSWKAHRLRRPQSEAKMTARMQQILAHPVGALKTRQ